MKNWGFLFCFFCSYALINSAKGQNISNEGRDFWAVFPTHDPSRGSLANIQIFITSKEQSEVTITCNTYNSGPQTIAPNTAVSFEIPRQDAYISAGDAGRVLSSRAIHVVVTPGKPKVAVYAHIFAGHRSAASIILPAEALGQTYYSMNYTQSVSGQATNRNYIAVVATEDDTHLLLHPKGSSLPPVQITLPKAGDAYEYVPNGLDDLTGSLVEVDKSFPDNCNKRFAIFTGSTSVLIGDCFDAQRNQSLDPLYQQLYPITSWGKTYGIVPFIDRYYTIRIVAQDDNTQVSFNRKSFILNKGDVYADGEFLSQPTFVTASKNVSVAQYELSQNCGNVTGAPLGDPEMVILNPIEFNIKAVTLFSSTQQDILLRYVNVVMRTSAAPSFKIDGVAPTGWKIMPSDPSYSYIQVPITETSSNLTASQGFNAVAYGFGDTESYAYSAGTSLAANNYLVINNTVTNRDATSACIDQSSRFKIVLDYLADKITWSLDEGPAVEYTRLKETIPSPTGLKYVYEYNYEFIPTKLEKRKMLVTVYKTDPLNCFSGSIEYDFTFDIYPIPLAKAKVDLNPCADTDVLFSDNNSESFVPGLPVNQWLWDFGDEGRSIEQNPIHRFKTSGEHLVRFSVGLDDGCMSDPIELKIIVKPKITPLINVNVNGCVTLPVVFTDGSTVEGSGRIESKTWDFGDGNAAPSTTSTISHSYQKAGTYTVKLTVVSSDGCTNSTTQEITINELPVVDFKLPDACIEDIVVFTNASEGINIAANQMTYLWDFGEPSSASNTSSSKDGSHQYAAAGTYNIKLTVTNQNGCSFTKTQQFILNSSEVNADFTVSNSEQLCSNKPIVMVNNSSLTYGKITKIEFFMGEGGTTSNTPSFPADLNPVPGKEYAFTYPAFSDNQDRSFNIKMIAYSGEQCFDVIEKVITIKASPALVFDGVPSICLNAGVTTITQARETRNVAGTGRFSGPGISTQGLFNPIAAGLGVHDITYTYTAQNACEESITQQVTVYPSPVITMDKDIFILTGGQKKVNASATGNGLTYKWTPSIGLDKDNILNPTIQGGDERLYTLTVTSSQGCSTSQTIMLNVLSSIEPYNVFSPNGDRVNDTWAIKYIDTYPNVEIEIFSRYGQRVFYSKGYTLPFDGNFNNQPLPVGVYYYIINPNIGTKKVTGALTILR